MKYLLVALFILPAFIQAQPKNIQQSSKPAKEKVDTNAVRITIIDSVRIAKEEFKDTAVWVLTGRVNYKGDLVTANANGGGRESLGSAIGEYDVYKKEKNKRILTRTKLVGIRMDPKQDKKVKKQLEFDPIKEVQL